MEFSYRAKTSGKDFMMKQELIDAAEASGLSRDAIGCSFSVNSCCFDTPVMFGVLLSSYFSF
jgi:hypothetical protein